MSVTSVKVKWSGTNEHPRVERPVKDAHVAVQCYVAVLGASEDPHGASLECALCGGTQCRPRELCRL